MTLSQSELAQYEEADEDGVRLEMVSGQPFWEFQPNYDHQRRLLNIAKSVRPDPKAETGGGCFEAIDVGIRFPDDSLRRPDLSIFGREPERRELITLVPEAVVEIVSQRSRQKDLVISPPFYLEMGGEGCAGLRPVYRRRSPFPERRKSPFQAWAHGSA
ncbi:Uma2 family endonuclease [Fimbriimonas ginsengisoli]|uniref:Putative restriction endonuclease domain-containing protein n=1 Tax=Fimbriimonas ginsengisoli Gsoil 348 TaxID=661478 RepID=A0A068NTD5_FIMGI|nr:Uma2 family endonuclease [Fimbriimonas ginsengisoli]AIE84884.1 hypothetical protein OP10G_1516 [Fimbriimonas ginsengisoli Gsoil 348]